MSGALTALTLPELLVATAAGQSPERDHGNAPQLIISGRWQVAVYGADA